ncbi:alpha/beta fold hydrolase [Phenylobacterium sp.]|jgi:pimeloyl-ACP methyl ester carboxylesterase|uniref:alpha/beta fold hydrolase n=1 Tax=Phenylobacterium sp. TaxID=1871053 RepID=UPI003783E5EB
MPLLSIFRFVAALLSLLILGAAGYLLWSWYQGVWVVDATGLAYRVRDDWRLWTGLGLLAWSVLGRLVMLPLLARRDTRPTRPERAEGQAIAGASGSTLHVERHGPAGGPPILLTHGWGMDSTFWFYARQDLADRFNLTLWDLPGLGKSRAGAISLPAFADDLATLLEASGRRPVVLVGHSIGGMIIQTLVRDRPDLADRIAGVVLLNTTHTNPLRTMILSGLLRALQKPVIEPAMHLTRWLHPLVWLSKWQSYLSGSAHLAHRLGFGRYVTRSQLEHVTLLSTRNPPAVEAAGNLAMLHWDASNALARLHRPVLVVGGDKDIVTKLEANRRIADSAPQGDLHVVDGANHLGPMECAELYNKLIADFALAVQPAVSADMPARPAAGAPATPAQRPAAGPHQRPDARPY